MFWYLLNRAGILEEEESDLRNDARLKHLYEQKLVARYRLNLINLIDRPTRDVTQLRRGDEKRGVQRALRIIRKYKPRVVCFIGKVTFNTFRGSTRCDYGWQENLFHSRVYVAHFPLRGLASIRVREFREVKRMSGGGLSGLPLAHGELLNAAPEPRGK